MIHCLSGTLGKEDHKNITLLATDMSRVHGGGGVWQLITSFVIYLHRDIYGLTLYLLVSPLIIFENTFEPDQARRNVGPDLDQKCLTNVWYS